MLFPLLINAFLTHFYNAYILHTRGRSIIKIINNAVENNKEMLKLRIISYSNEALKLEKTYRKFKAIIPAMKYILILTGSVLLGTKLWAALVFHYENGMAYAYLFIAVMEYFLMLPTFLAMNQIIV